MAMEQPTTQTTSSSVSSFASAALDKTFSGPARENEALGVIEALFATHLCASPETNILTLPLKLRMAIGCPLNTEP